MKHKHRWMHKTKIAENIPGDKCLWLVHKCRCGLSTASQLKIIKRAKKRRRI